MKRLSLLLLLVSAVSCGHLGLDLQQDEDAEATEGPSEGGASSGDGDDAGGGDGDDVNPNLGGFPLVGFGGGLGSGGTLDCRGDCGRVSDGLVLLYDFEEGEGEIARDTSNVIPALDLSVPVSDGVRWIESGLEISAAVRLRSAVPALKLRDAVQATNEITLEAWVWPRYPEQGGPARFFTVSEGSLQRNFTLAQEGGRLIARLRTSETSFNGFPELVSPVVLSSQLSHVVYTRGGDGAEILYLNGVQVAEGERPGTITNWTTSYHLGVANEFGEDSITDRDWQGRVFLIAVYSRALNADEVLSNTRAGH